MINISYKFLFFHPKVKDYYKNLSNEKLNVILTLSSILLIILSGLNGMIFKAISIGKINYISIGASHVIGSSGTVVPHSFWIIQLNWIYFMISFILQLLFFGILFFVIKVINLTLKLNFDFGKKDIILIFQIFITMDVLFLAYVILEFSTGNIYGVTGLWTYDAGQLFIFLNFVSILFLVFYLTPKITSNLNIVNYQSNRNMFYSFLLLCIITGFETLMLLNIFTVLTLN